MKTWVKILLVEIWFLVGLPVLLIGLVFAFGLAGFFVAVFLAILWAWEFFAFSTIASVGRRSSCRSYRRRRRRKLPWRRRCALIWRIDRRASLSRFSVAVRIPGLLLDSPATPLRPSARPVGGPARKRRASGPCPAPGAGRGVARDRPGRHRRTVRGQAADRPGAPARPWPGASNGWS